MYNIQADCISQIESTIETLDKHASYRVYITYSPETVPVEFVTHENFRMLPSHLKTMSWLLAIRNPVKISFESKKLGSTEVILSTRVKDMKKKTSAEYIRKVKKDILHTIVNRNKSCEK